MLRISARILVRAPSFITRALSTRPLLLTKPPAGFGNFNKKGEIEEAIQKEKAKPKQEKPVEEEEEEKPKKSKKQPDLTVEVFNVKLNVNQLLTYGLPLAYILYLLSTSGKSEQEISYVQFKTNFLEKNLVDKLVVVNKQLVRVSLKQDASALPGQAAYTFTIGSVEGLERGIEESERERGVASKDKVAITYTNEVGLGAMAVNLLPTLVIFGMIYYFSKKAGGAAGGGGPNG